jgi:molybdopterin-biosynthesis enzyme MoeA-like protein
MRKAAKVEVIIVGNEILTGDILDTNTNWLGLVFQLPQNQYVHRPAL